MSEEEMRVNVPEWAEARVWLPHWAKRFEDGAALVPHEGGLTYYRDYLRDHPQLPGLSAALQEQSKTSRSGSIPILLLVGRGLAAEIADMLNERGYPIQAGEVRAQLDVATGAGEGE